MDKLEVMYVDRTEMHIAELLSRLPLEEENQYDV